MYTGQYECLEIFAKPMCDERAAVVLKKCDGTIVETRILSHAYGNWLRIPVEKESEYFLETEKAKVYLAYLSDRENILKYGICVLNVADDYKAINGADFKEWISTPYREQYHFSPVINWINDPNGLCWFKGYYHLFYQFNPFGQEWNNMYWGHAVSCDLVHWKHLPVVLEPQEDVLDNVSLKGGAFSGCAVTDEEEVLFYLTRHIGPQEDCEDTIQYQTMTKSKDMIHFEEEREIIREKPEGVKHDFRDPKVSKFGDRWYMVLGVQLNGKGSILLYESNDRENWKYKCPLIVEETPIQTIECPDFFEIDKKFVAMGAWMWHYDENGRYQQCRYYVGDWNGKEMDVQTQQWVDFGSNCYASQTFFHKGRRILIGWISDFYHEHVKTELGAYGSMTIPRVLHVKDNHVYTLPVEEIYQLQENLICNKIAKEINISEIENNRYYAKVSFEKPCDFEILMGKENEKSISLVSAEGIVSFEMKGVPSEKVKFPSCVRGCTEAEIFVDGRTVEVYLNRGEDVGTRLFYNNSNHGIFHLKSTEPSQIELYTMKSIW